MNMKRHHWLFLSLLLFAVQPAAPQDQKKTIFTIEPELSYSFGETQYEMVLRSGDVGVTGIRSLLEFPVNVFSMGTTVRLVGNAGTRHPWGLALTLTTNINDPAGKMRDGDWLLLASGQEFKFQYTESEQKMSSYTIALEASRGFKSGRRTSFDLLLGYRFQRIVQDLYGYSGWYWDGGEVPIRGDEHALYYRVLYHSPSLGFRLKVGNPDRTNYHFQAAFSPTYMKDHDDHLLRFKVATAAGWGEGILCQSGIRFNLKKEARNRPYLELVARFAYIHGSPSQTQRWYGDDPASPEDDTGIEISGIPHTIKLTQLSLGARLGVEL